MTPCVALQQAGESMKHPKLHDIGLAVMLVEVFKYKQEAKTC